MLIRVISDPSESCVVGAGVEARLKRVRKHRDGEEAGNKLIRPSKMF